MCMPLSGHLDDFLKLTLLQYAQNRFHLGLNNPLLPPTTQHSHLHLLTYYFLG